MTEMAIAFTLVPKQVARWSHFSLSNAQYSLASERHLGAFWVSG